MNWIKIGLFPSQRHHNLIRQLYNNFRLHVLALLSHNGWFFTSCILYSTIIIIALPFGLIVPTSFLLRRMQMRLRASPSCLSLSFWCLLASTDRNNGGLISGASSCSNYWGGDVLMVGEGWRYGGFAQGGGISTVGRWLMVVVLVAQIVGEGTLWKQAQNCFTFASFYVSPRAEWRMGNIRGWSSCRVIEKLIFQVLRTASRVGIGQTLSLSAFLLNLVGLV